MDKLIKIWIIVSITTIAAFLLPSLVAYADRIEGEFYVKAYDGSESNVTYAYDEELTPIIVIVNSNNNNDRGRCQQALVYWYNGTSQNRYANGTLFAPYNYLYSTIHFEGYGENCFYVEGQFNYIIDIGDNTITDDVLTSIGDSIFKGTDSPYDIEEITGFEFNDEIGDWVNPTIKYDMEIVKGVTISIPDDYIDDDYTIKWQPSEQLQSKEYYRNIEVEIYQIYCGRVKRLIWDSWTDYDTPKDLVATPYVYKQIWKGNGVKSESQRQLVADILGIHIDDGFIEEVYTSDFLLRYKYLDDNNILHYSSNFVYIQCKKDGTYTVSVPDTDDIEDIVPDIPTIDTPDYDDEIHISDDEDTEVTNIFNTIKSLFNTMKDFPDYFGKIFTMFPEWVTTLIAFGIGAIIIIGLLKAIL